MDSIQKILLFFYKVSIYLDFSINVCSLLYFHASFFLHSLLFFLSVLFFILVAQAFIQWPESGEVGVKLTDQFLITVKSGGDQRGNIMRGRHMH